MATPKFTSIDLDTAELHAPPCLITFETYPTPRVPAYEQFIALEQTLGDLGLATLVVGAQEKPRRCQAWFRGDEEAWTFDLAEERVMTVGAPTAITEAVHTIVEARANDGFTVVAGGVVNVEQGNGTIKAYLAEDSPAVCVGDMLTLRPDGKVALMQGANEQPVGVVAGVSRTRRNEADNGNVPLIVWHSSDKLQIGTPGSTGVIRLNNNDPIKLR